MSFSVFVAPTLSNWYILSVKSIQEPNKFYSLVAGLFP
jgi:hypothetical protein